MANIEKLGYGGYKVNGTTVRNYGELWEHTMKRIVDAEKKAKNYQDFANKMVTRLKRIKHNEKVYAAIAVLYERKHYEIVDIYDGKLLMDDLTRDWDFLDNI